MTVRRYLSDWLDESQSCYFVNFITLNIMCSAKTISHVFIYFNYALSEIIFSDFPSFHGGMPFDTDGWLYSLSTDF